jgi:hypothetical protein
MKKVVLRTWPNKDKEPPVDEIVEVEDDYDGNPYGDKVPFTVGSNQTIVDVETDIKNERSWEAFRIKTIHEIDKKIMECVKMWETCKLPRKNSIGALLCPCCKQYHTFPITLRPRPSGIGVMGCNNCGCKWDEARRV